MKNLTKAQIDAKMAVAGFPELRGLWESFKTGGGELEELEEADLARRGETHKGALLARPALILACAAGVGCFALLGKSWGFPGAAGVLDRLMQACLSALSGYLLLFIATAILRCWVHPWKALAARETASLLKRKDFRGWLDAAPQSLRVVERLKELGVGGLWDDPGYRIWIESSGEGLKTARPTAAADAVRLALREVLGSKEERVFRPGRFFDSLKEGKGSVTRFLGAHNPAVAASREGRLAPAEGAKLLRALKDEELTEASSGAKHLERAIAALESADFLPPGVVEASIWKRDPWVDLTRAQDFYSSASLRGDTFMDSLERRTKGALGPFGYMRNKSISAMDFRTGAGRGARARLAAVLATDGDGRRQAALFVDAVEGRFDVKPAVIRKALEDYARAAGFRAVIYHALPLNAVPLRFVSHLKDSGAPLSELELEYADSSRREYLDAFGSPLEPFEYAYPKGKVVGYCVDLSGGGFQARPATWGAVARRRLLGKGALQLLALSALACPAWALWRCQPGALPAAAVLCALAAVCARALLSKRRAKAPAPFIAAIVQDIGRNPAAVKMSYPERLAPKLGKLLEYFEDPKEGLAPFFEACLYNASVKDSHLENALKFMKKMDARQRARIAELVGLLWPRPDASLPGVGLSQDRPARLRAMEALLGKIDLLRRLSKGAPGRAWDARLLGRAARALDIPPEDALRLVEHRPRLLRGLSKPPRPLYAWILPAAAAMGLAWLWQSAAPQVPVWAAVLAVVAVLTGGTCLASTRLCLAPGVLRYEKTRRRLKEALAGAWTPSPGVRLMRELGIDTEQYAKSRIYEDPGRGVRVEIRDKRSPLGAAEFLTSSEEIGNCIALRHFVSWCLPSLLNDETVMLADVSLRGGGRGWQQRAQIWMVAAQRQGRPVLVVNSLEFNEEGARRLDELMPALLEVLRDVCRRAGFQELYVGLSEFGRRWLDERYPQGAGEDPILKVHHPSLGYAYSFDVFSLRRAGALGKRYEYRKRRSLAARAYALLFGAIERLQGNEAKAQAFFDCARDGHNFWAVPLAVQAGFKTLEDPKIHSAQ